MQPEIYAGLRLQVRALVDEIEKRVGFEISVKSKGEREDDKFVAEEFGESVVGVITSPTSITIESPTTVDEITDEDYIHELLHIRRMFIAKIPHLYPKKQINGNAASAIDNWLEHLIIYEDQRAM